MHQKKFDSFRGVAAIVVLLGHIVQSLMERLTGPDATIVLTAGIAARHAVLVFFLLSGYLITASIRANIRKNGRFVAIDYLTARITRIYPPLVGAILLSLLVLGAIHGFDLTAHYGLPTDLYVAREAFTISPKDVALALVMQNGMLVADGPLWSLYMEFHLYVLAMLMVMGGWWRLVAAVLFAFWTGINHDFAFFALVWAAGAAIAMGLRVPGWIALLAVGTSIAAPPMGYLAQTLACVGYAWLMFSTREWAVPKWITATSDYSYSLYVIHFPLLMLALSCTQEWMGSSWQRTVLVAGLCVPIALLTAHYFARVFENQKRFRPWIHRALARPFQAPRLPAQP